MTARRRGTLRWRLALGMTALALATAALVGLFGFLLGGWIGYDPEPVTVTRVEQVGDRVALVQITSENSTATADRARRDGVRWMLTAMAVSFVPAALLAWVVAGRVLKPVEQVADVVDRVDGSESGDRVDLAPRDDELGRLATGVDHMLDRLDARREEQRQLLHEVVHELRTPLAGRDDQPRAGCERPCNRRRDGNAGGRGTSRDRPYGACGRRSRRAWPSVARRHG